MSPLLYFKKECIDFLKSRPVLCFNFLSIIYCCMISQVILIEFTLSNLPEQVYPSCLVSIERDYLSIDKRYTRLFIPPEFSKVHYCLLVVINNFGGNKYIFKINLNKLVIKLFKKKINEPEHNFLP